MSQDEIRQTPPKKGVRIDGQAKRTIAAGIPVKTVNVKTETVENYLRMTRRSK